MTVSFEEALFYEYFRLLLPDETIVLCDREQLGDGKELDLWFPGRRLAIEVGSQYVHGQSTDKDANKRQLAKGNDIRLVSVITGMKKEMPRKNGTPLLVTPSPDDSDVFWCKNELDKKTTLTAFLQIVKPVCKATGLKYSPLSGGEWPELRARAIARCDTIDVLGAGLGADGATGTPARRGSGTVSAGAPSAVRRPQPGRPRHASANAIPDNIDNVVIESIRGDWLAVYAMMVERPAGEGRKFADSLIDKYFDKAAKVEGWSPTIRGRLASLAHNEFNHQASGSLIAGVGTPVALLHALACAYGVYCSHAATVGRVLDDVARRYPR